MLAPLVRYTIRGAIWYQGESNAQAYRSYEYRELFAALIDDWRVAWNQGPFPFLFVQLANWLPRHAEPVESHWAELREAQWLTMRTVPMTGMAVTIDIGDMEDIHPRNKQDVGRRLALEARRVAYGESIVSSGPLYRGMRIEGNRVRVLFDSVGGGLVARTEPLAEFAVAGRDGAFVRAEARIDGPSVVVSSAAVPNPIAVRYAWQDNPQASLYNREGLPATPFRSDAWSELNRPRSSVRAPDGRSRARAAAGARAPARVKRLSARPRTGPIGWSGTVNDRPYRAFEIPPPDRLRGRPKPQPRARSEELLEIPRAVQPPPN